MNFSIFDVAYFLALIGMTLTVVGSFLGIGVLSIIGPLLILSCLVLVWTIYHIYGVKLVDGKFYANINPRGERSDDGGKKN